MIFPAKETGATVGVGFDVMLAVGDGADVTFDVGEGVSLGAGVGPVVGAVFGVQASRNTARTREAEAVNNRNLLFFIVTSSPFVEISQNARP